MAASQESSDLPTTHRSVRQGNNGSIIIQDSSSVAHLEHDMILVRPTYVAINPNDYKLAFNFPRPGLAVGSDFAGIIVAIGNGVKRTDIHVGDRICGAVHGSNQLRPNVGSFGEYITAYADCIFKLPESMAWENAAAIGGAVPGTLGLALVESLAIPAHPEKPATDPFFCLVWGGSTASGTMALQLLKL
jgi:NADPH:quinone reductase-like Zn-dependent oxidoreductase